MIGTAARALGAGSFLVVAALLGAGGPDPATACRAAQLVEGGSGAALEAIGALGTTDAMITLVTRRIDVTQADDDEAAAAAAAEFSGLAEEADVAERALRIAIGEAADAATRPAVQHVGVAMASIRQLREAISSAIGQS
ncbi:MAG: hypothetical protein LC744_02325 [Chloroflexi bacterium]|nr:hypothetical protein [Chloroflexota bacterium]